VAVVLAARDAMTPQHTVRGPTTTTGTAARNDKMVMMTTVSLVAPMEGKDQLDLDRLGDTTPPMVNLTSQAMEAITTAGTTTTAARDPDATMTTTNINPAKPATAEDTKTTTAFPVVPMAGKDKLVLDHILGCITHPMVNLTS